MQVEHREVQVRHLRDDFGGRLMFVPFVRAYNHSRCVDRVTTLYRFRTVVSSVPATIPTLDGDEFC